MSNVIEEATPDEMRRADRIVNGTRPAMHRQIVRLLVKVRRLEAELREKRAELRSQWGWQ